MIFYFSGTGNSLYIAKKIGEETNDTIVSITKELLDKQCCYTLQEGERLGFVFPVYWYGVPTIVEEFLLKLQIKNYTNQYTYMVATYGIAAGNVLSTPIKILSRKDIKVKGHFGVKMVDNYIVGYNIAGTMKQNEILEKAETDLKIIIPAIQDQEEKTFIKKGILCLSSNLVHKRYKATNHTKKFYVTNQCNSCSACVRNCPCAVITLENGKPQWNGECSFCLACINRCPQVAIQYGKGTARRGRYYNPKLKGNKNEIGN
ncbi:MAG TPA: EFR1 family ferrodoxin [Lachnospiraceae bacterium]|nr:EFR1 family ferrodoxin [Lachnospiraceae bacterium]